MNKVRFAISLLLFIIFIAGCSSSNTEKSKKPVIYTSVYPFEYITKEIAADTVSVESIYPPGVDVHSYEPTAKEMTSIAKGDAFIYMGAGLESFSDKLASTLDNQEIEFLEIGKNEDLFIKSNLHNNDDIEDEHQHRELDPHLWLDPIRMIDMSKMIQDQLIDLYPENKNKYKENFEQLEIKLTKLDEEFHKKLDSKENKQILVSHAAYGYWEEKYGIEQIAINGMFEDEPSQKDLANIARTAKKNNIKYVIFEQNGSSRISKVIQKNIGAKALFINNLEVRTEENIEAKEDYIDLMKINLETLDKATN